jgi:hypothetical protein
LNKDQGLSIFKLNGEQPELKMFLDIKKFFPKFKETPSIIRWPVLDSSAILAFSRTDVVIAVRGQSHLTPLFRKWFNFKDIVDVEFVPFAEKYVAILTKEENEVYIIDWKNANSHIYPEDIKARYKSRIKCNKIYFYGSDKHKNNRINMLLIDKRFGVLIKVKLGKGIELKEAGRIPIAIEGAQPLIHFNIFYGLLFLLYPDTGVLYVYKYNTELTLFCKKKLKLIKFPTLLTATIEGNGMTTIKMFVVDMEGTKSYRFTSGKISLCVSKKSIEIEDHYFKRKLELFDNQVNLNIKEDIERLAVMSNNKFEAEVSSKGNIKTVGTNLRMLGQNNEEVLKSKLSKDVSDAVKEELKDTIIPLMETFFKKILGEIDKETNLAIVKFSKEYELQSAKIDSMCLLYEMNMDNIMKQHAKYTEMVTDLIKQNNRMKQEYILQATDIPHIPYHAEPQLSYNQSVSPFETLSEYQIPRAPEHIPVNSLDTFIGDEEFSNREDIEV